MNETNHLELSSVGEGQHKVLVIHGSGSAAKPYLRLGQLLCELVPEVEVTALSLAGYGSLAFDSDAPILEQHLQVIDAATQEGTWHLIGHSMGGFLALQGALRFPERFKSLALIEPTGFGVLDPDEDRAVLEEDRAVVDAYRDNRESGGLSIFIEAWNQTKWESMPEPVRVQLLQMEPQLYEEVLGISYDETPLSAYEELKCPLLLVIGTDSLLPAQRPGERLASLPCASPIKWIDGAKHMDVLREPGLFAPVLADHISSVIQEESHD